MSNSQQTYLQRQANYPTEENIKASKIIARATIRIPGREGVTIITAFQLSYYFAFWFVFTAKSARSPRRTWKQIRREKPCITFPHSKTLTLDEMIAMIIGNTEGAKVTKSYPVGKRIFANHLDRVANPMKHTAPRPEGFTAQTTYVNRKNGLGRSGRFVAVGR